MDESAKSVDVLCTRFLEEITPLVLPVVNALGLHQVGPVSYFGVDPKGAGRLFEVRYQSPDIQLRISTVDGAAEVRVAAIPRPGDPAEWLWPWQATALLVGTGVSVEDLKSLQARADSAAWI